MAKFREVKSRPKTQKRTTSELEQSYSKTSSLVPIYCDNIAHVSDATVVMLELMISSLGELNLLPTAMCFMM